MSRTLKDRPDWVKTNDKKVPRTACHDHENAGRPIYRSRVVEDENGNPVKKAYTVYDVIGYGHYDYFGEIAILYPTWTEFYETHHEDEEFRNNMHYYRRYGQVERYTNQYETVIIGYRPTECTIDKSIIRKSSCWTEHSLTHLCEYELARWTQPSCSCCHPDTYDAKLFHRRSRSNEKVALRKLTKEAYAGYEYEDDDYEDVLNARNTFYRGHW